MIETINRDPEGGEAIPWQRAATQLEQLRPAGGSRGPTCWLSTIRPDSLSPRDHPAPERKRDDHWRQHSR
jgi:hypothetical protein